MASMVAPMADEVGHGVGLLHGHRQGHKLKDLALKSTITGQHEPFCPNPNNEFLPKEYETRVQVIQKFPEMKAIEETVYVKEIRNETRTVWTPRSRVVVEEHKRIDMVPMVKEVPKARIEVVYRVVEEEREVVDMVPVVEMVPVRRIEKIPRVVTEEIEETVQVPAVFEVPRVRTIEVPTGNYCEVEAGNYVNPSHFDLLGEGHRFRRSSSSSDSSDAEERAFSPRNRSKRSLLQKIEDKIGL